MRRILTLLFCAAALFAADAPRRAPGFSLVDSRGQEHDLADYRGKVVLLTLIQTTCPHCATFAQILRDAQTKYGDKVAVIAIVNPPDDAGKVAQFITGHKLNYSVLFDSGQMAYSYVLTPNLNFPRLFIIDKAGMIRGDHVYSPLTKEIFEGQGLAPLVDAVLNAGAPAKK